MVKQAEENIKTDDSTSHDEENTPYNNPYMYAYPPEYYYDDEYDENMMRMKTNKSHLK
ncbi:MAG: hypothetical protein Ct9H300mP2_1320 [Candidatus Neomarinimicrobiota bacterium]|nr:MAG: hypothetical protein Ct9H300mP2_1320 [Candidatus Neomarinimicrobiota bacterium]